MRPLVKLVVACLVVTLLMSCAGRRARQAQMLPPLPPSGSTCTSPAVGSCPVCTIQCPVGQPAFCMPGEAVANTCAVQPSCKCGPPS